MKKAKGKEAAKKKPTQARYTPGKEYEFTTQGMLWWRPANERGEVSSRHAVRLANFNAELIQELMEDDGAETTLTFKIAASIGKRAKTITIPARDFDAMGWITSQLGARAIVFPNMRDQTRSAIKILSTNIEERNVYKHIGWRTLESHPLYLHTGGAIGARGHQAMEVKLQPALAHYTLPAPRKKGEIKKAIRASMRMLDIAPDRITFPGFAAIWRGILGNAPFSLHFSGLTGSGKSQIAALMQQHFGPAMNADHFPANWSASANALEELAFEAKNALLTIDDFVAGSPAELVALNIKADRVMRAQGNTSGRIRMNADLTLRAARPPRGLIVSTGEEIPGGHSLRARLIVLEMTPKDLNWGDEKQGPTLTQCQADAAAGLYAMATAGFVRWLAPRLKQAEKAMGEALIQFRQTSQKIGGQHRRTPDNICNLMQGFYVWLQYATAAGAIDTKQRAKLWERAVKALHALIDFQSANQASSDPTLQFFLLISAALASGRAHLVNQNGGQPSAADAPRLGWRREGRELLPAGQKIGWAEGDNIYLESTAAFAVAQQLGKETNQAIALSLPTLQRRLKQAGRLESSDDARETVTVRRVLEGSRRPVLHISGATLYPSEKPDQPDHGKMELIRPVLEMAEITDQPDQTDQSPTTPTPIERHGKTQMGGLVRFPTGKRGRVDLAPKPAKATKKLPDHDPTKRAGSDTKIVKHVLNKYSATCDYIRNFYDVGAGFIANLVTRCRAVYPEVTDADIAAVARECYLRDKNKQTSAGLFLVTVPDELYRLHKRYGLKADKPAPTPAEEKERADRHAAEMAESAARVANWTDCPTCKVTQSVREDGLCYSGFCIKARKQAGQ